MFASRHVERPNTVDDARVVTENICADFAGETNELSNCRTDEMLVVTERWPIAIAKGDLDKALPRLEIGKVADRLSCKCCPLLH